MNSQRASRNIFALAKRMKVGFRLFLGRRPTAGTFWIFNKRYTYCAFAALSILKKTHCINLQKLLYWVSRRQEMILGGFNGRTNKVVDACYTFWQGALYPLLSEALQMTIKPNVQDLHKYILLCCQDRESGGLRDKPGKPKDLYHTCYTLSGLRYVFFL